MKPPVIDMRHPELDGTGRVTEPEFWHVWFERGWRFDAYVNDRGGRYVSLVADAGLHPEEPTYRQVSPAGAVETVLLATNYTVVQIINQSDTDWIYFLVDPPEGVDPGIREDGSLPLPPGADVLVRSTAGGSSTVKLTSEGTPEFCVIGLTT